MSCTNNVAKITPTMDYHTIQNRVIANYPETTIDLGIVYEGDDFEVAKEYGKIIYSHTVKNPFQINKKIIGAYCVMKNRRGEFITVMDKAELDKCKNMSKNKSEWSCWRQWEGEMCLKTVLKRACKRYFFDEVKDLLDEDNENYDLNLNQSKNSPFTHFMELIKNFSEDKRKILVEQWEALNNNLTAQRDLFYKVKKGIWDKDTEVDFYDDHNK